MCMFETKSGALLWPRWSYLMSLGSMYFWHEEEEKGLNPYMFAKACVDNSGCVTWDLCCEVRGYSLQNELCYDIIILQYIQYNKGIGVKETQEETILWFIVFHSPPRLYPYHTFSPSYTKVCKERKEIRKKRNSQWQVCAAVSTLNQHHLTNIPPQSWDSAERPWR